MKMEMSSNGMASSPTLKTGSGQKTRSVNKRQSSGKCWTSRLNLFGYTDPIANVSMSTASHLITWGLLLKSGARHKLRVRSFIQTTGSGTGLFCRSQSSGSAGQLELRLRGSDGSYRWFLARYNSVRDNNGQILRWYVSCTDIEDRKRAEERLQQENVALREEIDRASMFEEIVGTSPALQAVLSRISKVAPTDST